MITEDQRELLLGILSETERLDKVQLSIDPTTRNVTIVLEDLDDEWFNEVRDTLPRT